MIEIVVAPSAGFCFGVRRAVQLAERAVGERRQGRVVSLGPLVHNHQEVDRLQSLGVEPVDLDGVAPGDTVIVRSHGVPAPLLQELEARATGPIHDATCPHVRSCQERAGRMAAAGYAVVIVGDPGHPETESIASHARRARGEEPDVHRGQEGDDPALVQVAATVADLTAADTVKRVAVVAQTTQSLEQLTQVASACLALFGEVRVFNTICDATTVRQREAQELARTADLVLVVGGRHSANTTRLAQLCAQVQPRTRQIEQATEIEAAWMSASSRVLVTAGASTPRRAVDAVVRRLEELARTMDDVDLGAFGKTQ